MARPVISRYSLNPPLKKGRRFAFSVLEGALVGILSLFCFMIAGFFDFSIPLYASPSKEASSLSADIAALVLESGAGESDGQSGLLSYASRAEKFLKGSTRASLSAHGHEISGLYYAGVEEYSDKADRAYYYLASYKPGHANGFDDLSFLGKSAYLSYFSSGFFEEGGGYPLLQENIALSLDEYFRQPSYLPGKTNADILTNSYESLCADVSKDLQAHSLPYRSLFTSYETCRDAIYRFKIGEAFLCHLLSCLLYFFALSYLVKEKQTLGRRILHCPLIKNDGTLVPWHGKLLRSLLLCLETSLIPSFLPFLYYGGGAVDLFVRPLIGPFSLLAFFLASLILVLLDYFGCFYLKHQSSLSEFLFKAKSVDGREG